MVLYLYFLYFINDFKKELDLNEIKNKITSIFNITSNNVVHNNSNVYNERSSFVYLFPNKLIVLFAIKSIMLKSLLYLSSINVIGQSQNK